MTKSLFIYRKSKKKKQGASSSSSQYVQRSKTDAVPFVMTTAPLKDHYKHGIKVTLPRPSFSSLVTAHTLTSLIHNQVLGPLQFPIISEECAAYGMHQNASVVLSRSSACL